MDDGRRMTDTGRRTDDGPWLYYKFTNDPKGSGELKSYPFFEWHFWHNFIQDFVWKR